MVNNRAKSPTQFLPVEFLLLNSGWCVLQNKVINSLVGRGQRAARRLLVSAFTQIAYLLEVGEGTLRS